MSLDERLRRALSSEPDDGEAIERVWASLSSQGGRLSEPAGTRRAAPLVLGLVIGVAAIALVLASLGIDRPDARDSVAGSSPPPEVLASVVMDGLVTDVLPFDSGAWVVQPEVDLSDACSGVLRSVVQADDRSLQASPDGLLLGGGPQASVLGAPDEGWILQSPCTGDGDGGELVKVDLRQGLVSSHIPVPQEGNPSGIAVRGSTVVAAWQGLENEGTITVIDATSGEILQSIAMHGRVAGLTSSLDGVWVLDSEVGSGGVMLLAAPSLERTLSWDLPDPQGLVLAGDGSAWVGIGGGLARLDASGGLEIVDVASGSPVPLGADEAGVWFVAPSTSGSGSILGHVDLATHVVDASLDLDFRSEEGAVDPMARNIWLTTAAGETGTRVVLVRF